MEEHWLAEWFLCSENALQWQRAVENDASLTSDAGRSRSDAAGDISQYLIQKGCFAFEADVILRRIAKMQGKALPTVRRLKKFYRAANSERNVATVGKREVIPETSLPADDPPEVTSPQRKSKKRCKLVNGTSVEKTQWKAHRWSKADEAALVEWLETDDNLEKWRNAGVNDPSAETPPDSRNKTELGKIAREWIVERCGTATGLFTVKAIKEKVAVMLSDWNTANEYLLRTGKEAVTFGEAWTLKRAAHESLPTGADSTQHAENAADVEDSPPASPPAVAVNAMRNGALDEEESAAVILAFLSRKALAHRIWPPRLSRVKKYRCRRGCEARLPTPLLRDIHHVRHRRGDWAADASTPVCPACDAVPDDWMALCDHVDAEHRLLGVYRRPKPVKAMKVKRIKGESGRSVYPKCQECEMEFISRPVREVHYWRHEETLPEDTDQEQQCPACTFSTVSRSTLIAHVDERHSRKDLHQCPRCKRSFISYRRLERHIQHTHLMSDAEKPLECPTCHKKFSSNPSFVRHLKVHLGPDSISCPLCEQKFPKLPKLYEHMQQLHSTDGQLVCSICDRKVPIKCKESFKNFRIHARGHVEYHEYPCNICGKIFKRSSSRTKHMEGVHSAGRHHRCDCGKAFTSRGHLRQHKRVVHEKDKVDGRKNATGGKSVAQNKDYVPPQKTKHYSEFPYQCEECQQGFVRRGMFAYHLTVRHPERSLDAEPQLMLSSTAVHPNQ
ncbi:zinc finger protein 564-like [Paramacrobiotus metropolitanus]|uniref:zinc finger protein 564-like n=1 Tax=Paramacrobiotus metropolitanus TaxID=2943436 RepID=UPI002445B9A1|nr:zinc finger protein 564-like [Paramacrobiotus metropolitanus]